MESRDLLEDAYERIADLVRRIADGLEPDDLIYRPDPDANSIGWLLWHLTRVEDDHVSEIAGLEEAWVTDGWAERFGMEPDPANTGYGHTSTDVAAVRPASAQLLIDYHDAVWARTRAYLETIDAGELDRLIDFSWDPPVSVGVRLVSVIGDCYQHAGQAAYLKGMLDRLPSAG